LPPQNRETITIIIMAITINTVLNPTAAPTFKVPVTAEQLLSRLKSKTIAAEGFF